MQRTSVHFASRLRGQRPRSSYKRHWLSPSVSGHHLLDKEVGRRQHEHYKSLHNAHRPFHHYFRQMYLCSPPLGRSKVDKYGKISSYHAVQMASQPNREWQTPWDSIGKSGYGTAEQELRRALRQDVIEPLPVKFGDDVADRTIARLLSLRFEWDKEDDLLAQGVVPAHMYALSSHSARFASKQESCKLNTNTMCANVKTLQNSNNINSNSNNNVSIYSNSKKFSAYNARDNDGTMEEVYISGVKVRIRSPLPSSPSCLEQLESSPSSSSSSSLSSPSEFKESQLQKELLPLLSPSSSSTLRFSGVDAIPSFVLDLTRGPFLSHTLEPLLTLRWKAENRVASSVMQVIALRRKLHAQSIIALPPRSLLYLVKAVASAEMEEPALDVAIGVAVAEHYNTYSFLECVELLRCLRRVAFVQQLPQLTVQENHTSSQSNITTTTKTNTTSNSLVQTPLYQDALLMQSVLFRYAKDASPLLMERVWSRLPEMLHYFQRHHRYLDWMDVVLLALELCGVQRLPSNLPNPVSHVKSASKYLFLRYTLHIDKSFTCSLLANFDKLNVLHRMMRKDRNHSNNNRITLALAINSNNNNNNNNAATNNITLNSSNTNETFRSVDAHGNLHSSHNDKQVTIEQEQEEEEEDYDIESFPMRTLADGHWTNPSEVECTSNLILWTTASTLVRLTAESVGELLEHVLHVLHSHITLSMKNVEMEEKLQEEQLEECKSEVLEDKSKICNSNTSEWEQQTTLFHSDNSEEEQELLSSSTSLSHEPSKTYLKEEEQEEEDSILCNSNHKRTIQFPLFRSYTIHPFAAKQTPHHLIRWRLLPFTAFPEVCYVLPPPFLKITQRVTSKMEARKMFNQLSAAECQKCDSKTTITENDDNKQNIEREVILPSHIAMSENKDKIVFIESAKYNRQHFTIQQSPQVLKHVQRACEALKWGTYILRCCRALIYDLPLHDGLYSNNNIVNSIDSVNNSSSNTYIDKIASQRQELCYEFARSKVQLHMDALFTFISWKEIDSLIQDMKEKCCANDWTSYSSNKNSNINYNKQKDKETVSSSYEQQKTNQEGQQSQQQQQEEECALPNEVNNVSYKDQAEMSELLLQMSDVELVQLLHEHVDKFELAVANMLDEHERYFSELYELDMTGDAGR